MTIYNLDFVKELVNAFNVSNYGSKVNTNFVVEGDTIVIKFNCDQGSAKRYLSQMARDLVREYYSDESVARHAFDLGSLPFNFDKGKWTHSKAGTQLTVPIDSGVIFNLKVHFTDVFEIDVKNRVIKKIDEEKPHLGKENIKKALNASISQVEIDPSSGYIKCLLFNSTNVQKYFVMALKAQMKEHGYNYLHFYDIDDNKIYFKDVENIGFVRSVIELSKKMAGYNFNFPSDSDLKVKSYKNAMSWLIFSLTGTPIHRYYYDEFIDKDRISNGDRFAFIPMVRDGSNLRYLNYMEADKINAKFSHDILTNVRGQTKDTESDEFGEVYALSDRQIALLIPVIIENSVINKEGQIEIDPGLRLQALSPAQSPFNSPTHAGPSGLRTPPNQRKKDTDSGYDSNSPPKPKDSGSSSGGPSSGLTELSSPTQEFPTRDQNVVLKDSPRQGSEKKQVLHNPVNLAETSKGFLPSPQLNSTAGNRVIEPEKCVGAAQNVQAGTSAWSQPIGFWSSPAPSAEPSLWQPSRPSSWQGANPVGTNPWAQQTNRLSSQGTPENKWISSMQLTKPGLSGFSWKGADKSVRATWYVSLTTGNDPTFSSPISVESIKNGVI